MANFDYFSYYKSLYDPTFPKREVEEFSRYFNGEIDKDYIIAQYYRLAITMARRFENTDIPLDDLIGMAMVGLLKALNSFKLEKKIKFVTYSATCINNEILMYIRKIKKHKVNISFEEPLNIDFDGNELTLQDLLEVEEEGYKEMEINTDKKILLEILDGFNERDKNIIKLIYYHGKKQWEVGEILGVSQSYVNRLEKKLLKEMREQYNQKVIA